jgi:hypothetical protein
MSIAGAANIFEGQTISAVDRYIAHANDQDSDMPLAIRSLAALARVGFIVIVTVSAGASAFAQAIKQPQCCHADRTDRTADRCIDGCA